MVDAIQFFVYYLLNYYENDLFKHCYSHDLTRKEWFDNDLISLMVDMANSISGTFGCGLFRKIMAYTKSQRMWASWNKLSNFHHLPSAQSKAHPLSFISFPSCCFSWQRGLPEDKYKFPLLNEPKQFVIIKYLVLKIEEHQETQWWKCKWFFFF